MRGSIRRAGLSVLLLTTAVLSAAVSLAAARSEQRMDDRQLPMIVLAWDGTGDFGPETPGTQTAGWQEALDACVQEKRDLYVKGGWGGREPIYHVSETIRIPATQDFRIEGGVYVVNWTGPGEKDLILVDSGMDCHYTFGILVYGGKGAALRVRPENPVPIDNFAVFVDSDIRASSIADPHPFRRGKREGGAGVIFDTDKASIVHSDFSFTAVLNFAACIVTPDSGSSFAHNRVACGHLHTNADSSTLLSVGKRSLQNAFDVRIGVDQGAAGVTGVRLFGAENTLELTTRGGFPAGNHLVFEEPASGNQVNLIRCGAELDPFAYLTDRARTPTNQLTWTGSPAPIRTMSATAGTFVYTQRLYPAVVRIVGGEVTGVELVRGSERVAYGPAKERELTLSVGDEVRITSTTAPTVQVIPLKVR